MSAQSLTFNHGIVNLPAFLPDGTQGVVRSLDATDLSQSHIQAVMMNTFHLMQRPGSSTIHALGGLHGMSGWSGPIFTDSGGFQAYSLIHQNPKAGTITNRGITFQPEGSSRKFQLTPEKCIQLQISYGSDLVICLDDCTHVDAPYQEQLASVKRTITWALRCKTEFTRQMNARRLPQDQQPRIFAVIQGGGEADLRRECAEALLEIGFDGYGYGGWPLDNQNKLLTEMISLTRNLVPLQFPMHALGVGHPENILACYDLGYDLFDSAMPTRDARHGRLYTFTNPETGSMAGLEGDWFDFRYINDEKNIKAKWPVSPFCDCLCCSHYSLGYLHHLFKINDSLFLRLATMHNLRFMTLLTDRIRLRSQFHISTGQR
jgi:queuine tRNA-ribosyltransferase